LSIFKRSPILFDDEIDVVADVRVALAPLAIAVKPSISLDVRIDADGNDAPYDELVV
jgi:hypothetical protein